MEPSQDNLHLSLCQHLNTSLLYSLSSSLWSLKLIMLIFSSIHKLYLPLTLIFFILDTFALLVTLEQVGLYWDDEIIFIPDSSDPETSKIQKKIIRGFKLLGVRIVIVSNLHFFDATLNLNNGTFKPFSKRNSNPTSINIDSNDPRSILKQIPNAMNQRINRLSPCKRKLKREKRYTMKPSFYFRMRI